MKVLCVLAALVLFTSPAAAQCSLEKILPDDVAAGDQVNHAVISGDRMLVGAWRADHQGTDSGAAYIFHLDNGSWVQEQELVGSDVGPGGWFGKHVDLDGDVAVVGCPEEWVADSPPGEAYVFRRTEAGWHEEQILRPNNPSSNGRFGAGVAVDGDRIIVGAYGAFGYGRAYIFGWDGGSWIEEAVLQSTDPATTHNFAAHAVAISEDRAVVGARYDHELGSQAGAAFVFRREGANWIQEQKLLASDGAAGDHLGWGILDMDGSRILVGAPDADSTGVNAGAAYVFDLVNGLWTETSKLVGSATMAGDRLGRAAISGDWAVVGARLADANGADSGEAYLFEFVDGQWIERTRYLAPDGDAGDQFGIPSIDGRHVAISARLNDNAADADAGAIYIAPLPTSARFTASQTFGKRPLAAGFTDESIGNVTNWFWDFGDGYFSSLQNPVHTYRTPGVYSVSLTATGPCGSSSMTRTDYVRVTAHPLLPWLNNPLVDTGRRR